MRGRQKGWAAVLLAGLAGVVGPGAALWMTALPAGAAQQPVDIGWSKTDKFYFAPKTTSVNVNDKIIWTNGTAERHTVTSDPGSTVFDSGDIRPDGQFEKRFSTPGTYTYHCKYHSEMTGTIEVGSPAPTTTSPPPATTTSTAAPTTTTTAPATTTTAEPTTTTTEPRSPAGPGPLPLPPVPSSAEATPPPPPGSSTSTSGPSTSTTTSTTPPTTATSAPPVLVDPAVPAPPGPGTPPASADPGRSTGDDIPTAAGPPAGAAGKLDAGAIALVAALVAVGAFGAWTLIRVRPGRV